jgi:uncharacterized protein YjiS (DUF1127 family)
VRDNEGFFMAARSASIDRSSDCADHTLDHAQSHRLPHVSSLRSWLAAFRSQVEEWKYRALSRAELTMFDAHELRDIRMTPSSAREEARKPFWKP